MREPEWRQPLECAFQLAGGLCGTVCLISGPDEDDGTRWLVCPYHGPAADVSWTRLDVARGLRGVRELAKRPERLAPEAMLVGVWFEWPHGWKRSGTPTPAEARQYVGSRVRRWMLPDLADELERLRVEGWRVQSMQQMEGPGEHGVSILATRGGG